MHGITHIIRWIIRKDLSLFGTAVGLSGVIGILCITTTIVSMSSVAKKMKEMLKFEMRLATRWISFSGLMLATCFHTPRCRIITIIFW